MELLALRGAPLKVSILGCWLLFGCSTPEVGAPTEINAEDAVALQKLDGTGIYPDAWVAPKARAALANRHRHPGLLIAGTNVLTGVADEELRLLVTFADGHQDSVVIRRTGDFEAIVPISGALGDSLTFGIRSTKMFVPSRLGTSADERTLSFRLRRITTVDADDLREGRPQGLEFPREVEVDPGVDGIYGDGWIADSARVVLYNPGGATGLFVKGYAAGGVSPDIVIHGNGVLVAQASLPRAESGMFSVTYPLPEAVRQADRVVLTIRPGGIFVPAERGMNDDTRRISYKLKELSLK